MIKFDLHLSKQKTEGNFIVSVGQLKRTKFTREFCFNCELNKSLYMFFFLDKKKSYAFLDKNLFLSFFI